MSWVHSFPSIFPEYLAQMWPESLWSSLKMRRNCDRLRCRKHLLNVAVSKPPFLQRKKDVRRDERFLLESSAMWGRY